MAKRFRPVHRDQPFLLPPDMREWLPAGHLAWFVIDAVDVLDISRFAARQTPRGSVAGRAAYDPRVLLGLLAYGYAVGVRSSRRIERACREDVAFRVICAQDVPDHATTARFRREHFADPAAMGQLFGEVLVLAARAAGKLGQIAVDGTKIAASASKDANRTEAGLRELARQILAEAEAVDAAEDALFGEARGDELPDELADPVTRRERIRKALAGLEAERAAAQQKRDQQASAYLERHEAGRGGRAPRQARVAAAQAKLDREIARYQAKTAARQARAKAARQAGRRVPAGKPPVPVSEYCRVKAAAARLASAKASAAQPVPGAAAEGEDRGPVRNITDPDSRLMPVRGGGFIQGLNAQAVFSTDGLCLAARVTQDTTDYASFEPMMREAQATQDLLRAHARGPLHRLRAKIGVMLADAGYCSEPNLTCPGPDRLIAVGKRRDLEHATSDHPAAAAGGQAAAAMAARLATPQGLVTYRRRGPLAEGPFGNTKHNRGFRRFSLRGLPRAEGEWAFQNAAGNLLKIHATGWQPAAAP